MATEFLDALTDEEIAELVALAGGSVDAIEPSFPDDPVAFAHDILGVKTWDKQDEILRSVKENRFTAVEAGHGVGKSFAAACAAVWFLTTHTDSVLITTAPTANLVSNILWRRIRTLFRRAKRKLPGRILETPRWEISSSWYGIGVSPKVEKKGELDFTAIQGFHAPYLFAIIDEAGGVSQEIFDAMESLVSSEDSRLLAIGNPVGQSGPFYRATQLGHYQHIRISCLEHPNVRLRREIIPGAVSYRWVAERFEKWAVPAQPGEAGAVSFGGKFWRPTALLQARVLGIPPESSEDRLISLLWLDEARRVKFKAGRPKVLAIDPAHGGEARSCFVIRAGKKVIGIWRRDFKHVEQVGSFGLSLIKSHEPDHVVVDATGVGAGVVDWLRASGVHVQGVVFSRSAKAKNRFSNLRTELFWSLREALRKKELELPKDDMLDVELSVQRMDFDSQGRISLPPKEGFEREIGRSLDSADALAMTFFIPFAEEESGGNEVVEKARMELSQPSRWIFSAKKTRSRWRR